MPAKPARPSRRRQSKPSSKPKPNQPNEYQLMYLAGLLDSTIGLRGTNTRYAIASNENPAWAEAMVEEFGGYAEIYLTSQRHRLRNGWFVDSLERRLELVKLCRPFSRLDDETLDTIEREIFQAIEKIQGAEDRKQDRNRSQQRAESAATRRQDYEKRRDEVF